MTIGETDDLARSRCKILQYMLQDVTSVTMTSTWICQLRGFGFGYLEALFTGGVFHQADGLLQFVDGVQLFRKKHM